MGMNDVDHERPGGRHPDHDGHGHGHDQGLRGFLRYLRHAPEMWTSEVNDAVVARLDPQADETVMDIGAGMGAGSMVAARSGCMVMAIEPTPYMRRILGLRARLKRLQHRVHVIDGAAEATGVDDGSIDAAWAVNTMHHWTDMASGVRELARVMAPGGRILLVDEDFDDPAHPDHESFGAGRHEDHSHHFHMVDADEVATVMREAGLSVTSAGKDTIAGRPAIIMEATAPSA